MCEHSATAPIANHTISRLKCHFSLNVFFPVGILHTLWYQLTPDLTISFETPMIDKSQQHVMAGEEEINENHYYNWVQVVGVKCGFKKSYKDH